MIALKRHSLLLAVLTVGAVASWAPAQTVSLDSGDWHDPAIWSTGLVPTADDDVLLAADHVVAISASASCRDFAYEATSAKLDMASVSAVLNVHGDFTFAAPNHLPFAGWTEGAQVRFTGPAEIQKLVNLSTSASSGTTRFNELVIDKSAGKVTTGGDDGIGDDRRLRIGRYLDIVSGTFELARTDDLEGRDNDGAATSPDILVRADGVFEMAGSTSHIRRGTFTGADSSKIGTLRVWGVASLNSGTTLRVNLTELVIEDGGIVEFPTGKNTTSGNFNPGTVTIRDGGQFRNSITTAYWYENTTTPTTLNIEAGGEFRTSSSSTTLPQVVVVDGEMRFFSGSNQTVPAGLPAIDGTLALTNDGTKTLGGDLAVNGRLLLYGQARLSTGGNTLTYGPSAVLQYGDESQISPQETSSEEYPAAGGPLDVVIHNPSGVTLHESRTVTGTLSILAGNLLTGSNEVVLASGAELVEAGEATVLGYVRSARTIGGGEASDFGGLGLQIQAGATAPGATTVVRRTGEQIAEFGLGRHYDIAPEQNTGLDATLTVSYGDWELEGVQEENLGLFRSIDDGLNWDERGGVVDTSGKTVTLAGIDSFSLWALGDADPVSSVGQLPAPLSLDQNFPNPFNPSTTIAFNLPEAGDATLTVHDLRGRHVRTLARGALEAGRHQVQWDGLDAKGNPSASGVYLVRLATTEGSQRTMKITLSK